MYRDGVHNKEAEEEEDGEEEEEEEKVARVQGADYSIEPLT
jgi:hypothetical protein